MVSQVFKASDWPNSNLVGGCVGGLSQVFKASDWPNSNLKDYKKKCFMLPPQGREYSSDCREGAN